jgi:hypothetical protein
MMGRYTSSSAGCGECAVVLAEQPVTLAPSDDEVSYGLDEWPTSDRIAVTDACRERNILYRWEDNYELVVPVATEAIVDTLLDEVEASAVTEWDGESDTDADAGAQGGAGESGDGEAGDGGPAAARAMSDLFVAADRLQHMPFDVPAIAAMRSAAEAARGSLPPYGVDRSLWRTMQRQAHDIVTAFDGGSAAELIAEHAQHLRALLRDLV